MAIAYITPGVSVEEQISPSFNPTLGEETSVCLVGPSRGYQTFAENVLLNDKDEYTLATNGVAPSTLVVVDASNLIADEYAVSSSAAGTDGDYVVDSSASDGTVVIHRAMPTLIDDGDTVVTYHENLATPTAVTSFSQELVLSGVDTTALAHLAATTQAATLKAQAVGFVPAADFTVATAGTSSVTITRTSGATVLRRFQNIWVDYDITSNAKGTITLVGGPTGGTFTVSRNGYTSSAVAYNVSAGGLQTALEGITDVGAGKISVARTGAGTNGDPYVYAYEFIDTLAATAQVLFSGASSLTGGTTPSVAVTSTVTGGVTTHYTNLAMQLQYNTGGSVDTVATLANQSSAATTLKWSKNHKIKNSTSAGASDTAATLTAGSSESGDYMVVTTNSDVTTTAIRRSKGTTTIGADAGRGQVRITYQATPTTYWVPTRVYSQSDVEDKFGAAFNSDGTVNSAVSFGAYLAFEAGASSTVVQALLSNNGGVFQQPTGIAQDWSDTLVVLRDYDDINVIVPILSGGLVAKITDEVASSILTAVRQHVQYMATTNQLIDVLAGEDGTGTAGQPATLQAHATALGLSDQGIDFGLITPGSFQYANPVTSQLMNLGGQFAACIYAGRMSARGVAESMTRQVLPTLRGVNVLRSKADKQADAEAGLIVLEPVGGLVRVRHAITTATARANVTPAQREQAVQRAKKFVIETMFNTLDQQTIGNLDADANAPFTVQVLVANVLEQLANNHVIVGYDPASVQVRRPANAPDTLEVRFSYQPLFVINNINLKFSLDLTGTDFTASVETTGA